MWIYKENELYHWGVLGMKWGKRKDKSEYKSTSWKARRAKRANDKVDAGFKNWKENDQKKSNAIELGKKANIAKIAYENNKSDKNLKTTYKTANKEYKSALKQNTTYRKGAVRKEVGQDLSRKYLSDAKKIKKQLNNNPLDKNLQKKYDDLMSKHDIERERARRAPEVAAKRSAKAAQFKRTMTTSAKVVAGTAVVVAGAYAVNSILKKHNVTIGGKNMYFSASNLQDIGSVAKRGVNYLKNLGGYFYR